MKDLDVNEDNFITQSNNLIEARYALTKNEQLILCAMISFINPDDEDFLTYKTSISDFIGILGVDKKSGKREIKNVVRKLLSRVLEIESSDGKWKMFQWVSYAEASPEEDYLLLRFHDKLRPYLLNLKRQFTSFRLREVVPLKSIYAIRMYQIVKEYDSKNKSSFLYMLEDFRKLMLGSENKKYSAFKDFRIRVIESAKKELDEKSNLSFEFSLIKMGRKIGKIEFFIKRLDENTFLELREFPNLDMKIIEEFESLGIKREFIQPYLDRDGEEALERTLQIFEKDKKSGKIRDSEQGYILSLLKAKAGVLTKAELKKQKQKEQKQQQLFEKKQKEQLESKRLSLSKTFLKQKKEIYLASLSEQEIDILFQEIRALYVGNLAILSKVKSIKSPIIQDKVNKVIKAQKGYVDEEAAYINANL